MAHEALRGVDKAAVDQAGVMSSSRMTRKCDSAAGQGFLLPFRDEDFAHEVSDQLRVVHMRPAFQALASQATSQGGSNSSNDLVLPSPESGAAINAGRTQFEEAVKAASNSPAICSFCH